MYGAGDASSGQAAMLEIARALGTYKKNGLFLSLFTLMEINEFRHHFPSDFNNEENIQGLSLRECT